MTNEDASYQIVTGDIDGTVRAWICQIHPGSHEEPPSTEPLVPLEVALAALDRLAAVEALFAGGPDTSCRTVWQDGIECVSVPLGELRDALGAAVTPTPQETTATFNCDCLLRFPWHLDVCPNRPVTSTPEAATEAQEAKGLCPRCGALCDGTGCRCDPECVRKWSNPRGTELQRATEEQRE